MTTHAVSHSMAYFIYKDKKGEWRWRLESSNGRIMADSGEGYKTRAGCLRAIKRVQQSGKAMVGYVE